VENRQLTLDLQTENKGSVVSGGELTIFLDGPAVDLGSLPNGSAVTEGECRPSPRACGHSEHEVVSSAGERSGAASKCPSASSPLLSQVRLRPQACVWAAAGASVRWDGSVDKLAPCLPDGVRGAALLQALHQPLAPALAGLRGLGKRLRCLINCSEKGSLWRRACGDVD